MRVAVIFLAGCSSLLDLQPPPVPLDAIATPSWTFSDDFELGDLQRWTSTAPFQSANGSFEIATTGAYAGCCALHASTSPPGTGFQYALEQWTQAVPMAPPVTSGTIAVRMYVRAAALDPDTRELTISEGGSKSKDIAESVGNGVDRGGSAWGKALDIEISGGAGLSVASIPCSVISAEPSDGARWELDPSDARRWTTS